MMAPLVALVGRLLGVGFALKVAQALFDEDYGTGRYPKEVRERLIDEHIAEHGCVCPRCDREVKRSDLAIDHIVARKNGGATSRANAQVMCGSCNSRKGARNTLLDYFLGRTRPSDDDKLFDW